MNASTRVLLSASIGGLLTLVGTASAQSPQQAPPAQNPGAQPAPRGGERRPGLFGKVTAIHDQSLEIATPAGGTVTVKINSDTQFRKEREAAKLSDFKVGDTIFVRGQENSDHTWTAQMIGERPAGGFVGGQGAGAGEGRGGPGSGPGMRPQGVLGQDYVAGEVKSVDAPNLTILRPDNVTQTIELNEETSLHKGRDSITMADIQAGDHVFVRGAMKNNAFQPANLMVIPPEQWQRMQQMGNDPASKPSPTNAKPPNPSSPSEPPH